MAWRSTSSPTSTHYAGIVPCGIRDYGVTSVARARGRGDDGEVDTALRETFDGVFGLNVGTNVRL